MVEHEAYMLQVTSSIPDNVRQSILVADRCWGTGYQLGVKTSKENVALQDVMQQQEMRSWIRSVEVWLPPLARLVRNGG